MCYTDLLKTTLNELRHFQNKNCLYYLIFSECPELGDKVNKGERHGEGAQEYVRQCQVGDKDVPGCQHYLDRSTYIVYLQVEERWMYNMVFLFSQNNYNNNIMYTLFIEMILGLMICIIQNVRKITDFLHNVNIKKIYYKNSSFMPL